MSQIVRRYSCIWIAAVSSTAIAQSASEQAGEWKLAQAAAPADQPKSTEAPAAATKPAEATPPPAAASETPVTSGWNGEHFFVRSSDGKFQLQPVGYFNANYTVYSGDAAPPDGFRIARARFGFQGSYTSSIDWVLQSDITATGISVRDAYVHLRPIKELQFTIGQFKVPFSQEVGLGDTNVEFTERSIVGVLYPDANGSYRSPGAMVHGDLFESTVQYYLGAFNGRGILAPATSNQPEIVARLRLWPGKLTGIDALKRLAIGGSTALGRVTGISGDTSFSGTINDGSFAFFPSFRINGPTQRWNAELLWLWGPFGVHAEYIESHQARESVGAEAVQGGGLETLPTIVGKGGYVQLTYFLTGETQDENLPPKVKRPVFGAFTPGGEKEYGFGGISLRARFSYLEGNAPGATFPTLTPTSIPSYYDHTQQWAFGINWYLNYWTLYKIDLNVDQLLNPSVQGSLPQTYFVVLQQIQFRF